MRSALASLTRAGRQSQPMSKDRKDVYLGDGLKRAIQGRPGTLSTNVNLIADRYMAIVERYRPKASDEVIAVLRKVLSESRGHMLEGREIAAFPSMVADWLERHPEDDILALRQSLAQTPYAELVALVDWLERQL